MTQTVHEDQLKNGSIINTDALIVGGGISGITAAIELAETFHHSLLLESQPSLGGRVAATNQYFPKLCPPTCGLEINLKRIKNSSYIKVLTLAEIQKVEGSPGAYRATVNIKPRYINEKCTACGKCAEACEVSIPNPFNYGLDKIKAIYLPHLMAYPFRYVVDRDHVNDPAVRKCAEVCEYGAIDFDMQQIQIVVNTKAIIWATGWRPYDANRLDNLGFGKYPDVVTNVMMERIASENGPYGGKIVRPSDGKEISSIGFVQCAGSRDENHLPYCSAVCCLASMKQAFYVRALYPEADIHIFYIDIRSPGRLEDFYAKAKQDPKLHFHRGKVGSITRNDTTGNLVLTAEDTLTGNIATIEVEMAVLAVGMVPNTAAEKPVTDIQLDPYGFFAPRQKSGIIGAGTALGPADVADSVRNATGAALKAINVTAGRK